MTCKNKKGFTLVELLVVMGIISLLLTIAVPAMQKAKMKAREVALKATLKAVETGLETFNSDQGFYPESAPDLTALVYPAADSDLDGVMDRTTDFVDTGAHKLVQALVGADRIGYQTQEYYNVNSVTGQPIDKTGKPTTRTMYLEIENLEINNFETVENAKQTAKLVSNGVDYDETTHGLAWQNPNPVIRDGLTRYSLPILYYKANTRNYLVAGNNTVNTGIYNYSHNVLFTDISGMGVNYGIDSMTDQDKVYNNFAYFVWDPKTAYFGAPMARPYKKDSYILMTAGPDNIYGTMDDICNYDPVAGKDVISNLQ